MTCWMIGTTTALVYDGFISAMRKSVMWPCQKRIQGDDRNPLRQFGFSHSPWNHPRCLSDPFMNALVNPNCMWLQGWTFLSKSGEQGLVWVYCSVWMKTCCSIERYVVWESPVLWKHTAQVSRVSELGLMRWPDVSAPAGVVPKMVLISYC